MHTKAIQTLPDGTQQASFQKDFFLDSKSMQTTVDDNGDLWIEGYASDWGIDRQDEMFEPGAFERGLKSFLEINPIMLYHHQYDKAMGQFVDAYVDENGLFVRGRVDKPAAGSWAEDVFNKVKRGTIKAFSVGGIFKRRGNKIYEADLGEISITPFPVNPRTTFAVVAKKAFDTKAENEEIVEQPVVEPTPEEVAAQEAQAAEEAAAAEKAAEQAAAEKAAEEAAEAKAAEQAAELTLSEVGPASITAAHLALGAVSTEHLSDELRSRVQQFAPEAPSVEEAHAKLGELTQQLSAVFDHIGIRVDGSDARLPQTS